MGSLSDSRKVIIAFMCKIVINEGPRLVKDKSHGIFQILGH